MPKLAEETAKATRATARVGQQKASQMQTPMVFSSTTEPADRSKSYAKFYAANGTPFRNLGRQLVKCESEQCTVLNLDFDVAEKLTQVCAALEKLGNQRRSRSPARDPKKDRRRSPSPRRESSLPRPSASAVEPTATRGPSATRSLAARLCGGWRPTFRWRDVPSSFGRSLPKPLAYSGSFASQTSWLAWRGN